MVYSGWEFLILQVTSLAKFLAWPVVVMVLLTRRVPTGSASLLEAIRNKIGSLRRVRAGNVELDFIKPPKLTALSETETTDEQPSERPEAGL